MKRCGDTKTKYSIIVLAGRGVALVLQCNLVTFISSTDMTKDANNGRNTGGAHVGVLETLKMFYILYEIYTVNNDTRLPILT